MIKSLLKKIINKTGYSLIANHNKPAKNWFTMDRALARTARRINEVHTVIDVGASDGRWSAACMRAFPKANYLLVEAQSRHTTGLEALKTEHPNVDYVIAVAGPSDGKVFFDDSDPFGGQAKTAIDTSENTTELPQISLDNEIHRKSLKGPFLLKLDTHGYEIPILEGAKELLKQAELVIIETYNFKLTDSSLRYWEMTKYMEEQGFAPIELVDFMLREKDQAFWQMDTFYIRKDHAVFKYNKYK